MNISQKCQYALRAVFELAKQQGTAPLTASQIAESQAIPPRFLEAILNDLRHGGFVTSKRGANGGYILTNTPEQVTAAQVIQFIDGPLIPVTCDNTTKDTCCSQDNQCVFSPMWTKANDSLIAVYDSFTFKHFIDEDKKAAAYIPNYSI